jgi:methylenetetrahydrofolate reductase (NADPH)
MAHLTCVNATKDQLADVLADAKARGIKNILALRGDPPTGTTEFTATDGGFEYSYQLVRFLREAGGFCVGTAGFPEGHIACKGGRELDWQRLKAKVDEGADFVLTQLFFDNDDFLRFRDYMTKQLNVNVPIDPGIIPILGAGQIKRFTALCGARIPASLHERLDKLDGDEEAVIQFGIDYATQQCEQLLREGVPGLHFYTLNKARSTIQILRNLGLAPAAAPVPL